MRTILFRRWGATNTQITELALTVAAVAATSTADGPVAVPSPANKPEPRTPEGRHRLPTFGWCGDRHLRGPHVRFVEHSASRAEPNVRSVL